MSIRGKRWHVPPRDDAPFLEAECWGCGRFLPDTSFHVDKSGLCDACWRVFLPVLAKASVRA